MKAYRVYDKIQKKYRTDVVVDQEGRILQFDVNNRTRLDELNFVVERGFRGIFEGDIMKTERQNRSGPVEFLDHLGLFTRKEGIISEGMYKLFNNKRKVEVIGNIHEK